MGSQRLQAVVPDGEALRYTAMARSGESIGLTDDRLLVVDEESTSVEYGSIEEVTMQEVDWFVGFLSVALVGFGALSLQRNALAGGGFVLAGLVSGYLVYRKRGKVQVNVRNRPKPLSFYLDDPETFLTRLEERLDSYEQCLVEEHEAKEGEDEEDVADSRTN